MKTYDGNVIMSGLWSDINMRVANGTSWKDVYLILKNKIEQIELYDNDQYSKVRW